ncbi:MAG TPA: ATP-binding protein, partial [Flavisolibacter sp.]|nr:ATP-binding protein [Flavisolibacter sp.]
EEFAYAASHDLKEPIRKIHLFTDRLKQELADQLNSHQQHLFDRVENASQRMGTLIEDLLTYSQFSKGASEFETVDLAKKVQNVLEDLEVEIEERHAKITVKDLPVIPGHKRQIQQLFQNLISNSLKYSRPDVQPEIWISGETVFGRQVPIALSKDEEDNKFHLIKVQDNGIGFDQQDAERIFNVFTRLHGNAEYKGTGVGLSIAQKVVENHHGRIWAKGKQNEGATFYIILPFE